MLQTIATSPDLVILLDSSYILPAGLSTPRPMVYTVWVSSLPPISSQSDEDGSMQFALCTCGSRS
jgi:hypothetical protein